MRSRASAGLCGLLLSIAACGSDGADDTSSSGGSGAGASAATDDPDPAGCSATGIRFTMTGAAQSTSVDAELIAWDGVVPDVLGVEGTTREGVPFLFMRAGDVSDGNLGEVRSYDVSRYPYNMRYGQIDVGSDCESGSCSGFIAFDGTLTVTQLTPTYEATFSLSALRDGAQREPGAPLDGTVTGCMSVPNP
jgi:hypothetical protein